MSGKVFELEDYLIPDHLGHAIARRWVDWNTRRQAREAQWTELQQYIYATDTTQTSNAKLPWSNKTTLPKICQIRDNLYSNYMATMFPRRKWMVWEGDDEQSQNKDKADAVESYLSWVIERTEFKKEIAKLVLDYIDYGNCFGMVEWRDDTQIIEDKQGVKSTAGYQGPVIRRINPVDIVFAPQAPSFEESPKIIRSLISLGEVKKMMEHYATSGDELEEAKAIYEYLREYRSALRSTWGQGDLRFKDDIYQIAGFDSYREYLESNYVECLSFYGNMYDEETDSYYENYIIHVVDRHKIIAKKPNPSNFGHAPIFHAGWRVRQDNLWAMGPLDNLIGMQYRIDHLENMKADVFDLIAYPPLKIRGYVEDFTWGPMEEIVVGDDGDVELLSPDVQALQADMQISILEQKMEEMAGAPKEAMGFRTPGEKTMYEVQRLENAASRIFQNKVGQFEQTQVEPLLNAMLEIARRRMSDTTIRIFDEEVEVTSFRQLTKEDITGNGRIRPLAAQHFAERANQIQNITQLWQNLIGVDPDLKMHFSSIKMAKLVEELSELDRYDMVDPFIRLSEQTEAQRIAAQQQQDLQAEAGTQGMEGPSELDALEAEIGGENPSGLAPESDLGSGEGPV